MRSHLLSCWLRVDYDQETLEILKGKLEQGIILAQKLLTV